MIKPLSTAKNTGNRTEAVNPLTERVGITAVVCGVKKTENTRCATNIRRNRKVGKVNV